VRLAACDADRGVADWTDWVESAEPAFDLAAVAASPPGRDTSPSRRPFLAVEALVDRGDGWRGPIRAYVSRAHGYVVAVDR
jgi:hypothetical protein